MRHPFNILFLAVATCVTACTASTPTDPLRSSSRAVVDATVQFLSLEGGCWTLKVNQNAYYSPLDLPDQFRHDGLKVQADLLRRDDYSSVCMVGPVVQILSIRFR